MSEESYLYKDTVAFRPFHYSWCVETTKKHENAHWVEEEAKLQDDVRQWSTGELTKQEKNLVTNILRLFTQMDVAVGENYLQLLGRFKNNEVRCMLLSFATREGIHQRAYALLNDTLGLPEEEYNSFMEYKEMSDKWEYVTTQNEDANRSFKDDALHLARMVFTEGVSLFASFAMLLNFQRFGKLKGTCEITEWSLRDESIHVEGNARLFRVLCDEHPRIVTEEFKKAIYDIARDIVRLEDRFIDLAFEMGEVEGLSADVVKKYVRFIADRRLIQLGLKGNWKIKILPEEIEWMSWVTAGPMHANFFESVVTDYSVVGLKGDGSEFYKVFDEAV